jgi:hypothetical protein
MLNSLPRAGWNRDEPVTQLFAPRGAQLPKGCDSVKTLSTMYFSVVLNSFLILFTVSY